MTVSEMPELDQPRIEIQECSINKTTKANKTKLKAFKSGAHMYKTIAREMKPTIFVGYVDISIKNSCYLRRTNIIRKPILGIGAYIVIVEVIARIINYCQWLAKKASGVSSRCRIGSSNFADNSFCLQQTKFSPSSDISPRTMDGCSDLNRPCTETETCGNTNEETISERNSEDYCRITNNLINLPLDIVNDIFTVKMKMNNDLLEIANPENVQTQKGKEFSGLKTDENQGNLHSQIVDLTGSGSQNSRTGSASSGCRFLRARNRSSSSRSGSPVSRSGSPSSRSGSHMSRSGLPSSRSGSQMSRSGSPSSRSRSPMSRSGLPRTRSGSPNSRSGSPMSRSGLPNSRSGSSMSRSGSSSSRSGPSSSSSRVTHFRSGSQSRSNDTSEHPCGISCSRKALLFAPTEEATKENTSLLDSGTPRAGTLEYDISYAGDIALGQTCVIEEDLKAFVLPCCIQDMCCTLENGSCKQSVKNLRKSANDGVLGESVIDRFSGKVVGGEFLGKAVSDELSMKTVSGEISGKTVSGELSRKTCSDELSGKTVSDELPWKTVSDELSGNIDIDELSRKTVSDELSRKTSWKTALDERDRKMAIIRIFSSILDIIFQNESDSNLTEKSTTVLPDDCSQPKLKHQCMASYRQNMRGKCRLAADGYTDAAEEIMKHKDMHNNHNVIPRFGKHLQQRMENMPYHLNVNNEKPEGIHQQSHRRLWFEQSSLIVSIFRKLLAAGQGLCDTEDTKGVPRKSNGLQDETDNQFEENGEECTETHFRKIVRKAVGIRTARDRSGKHCTYLNPERCHHKGKDMPSHKTVSTFGAAEMADQAVSRFGTIEMGDQDLDNCLKLILKFDPRRHIAWRQDIPVFHLALSAVPNSLYIFMDFEVFRLSSFGFNKFSKDGNILVTSLAKSGFYFMSLKEQIICFGCGIKFEESQDSSQSSADSFHHPQCTRRVTNKPLAVWLHDLNLDALTNYFIENGSVAAYLFETPSVVADPSTSGASNDVLKAGPVSDLNMFISDDSSGYASDALGYTESVENACTDDELSVDSSGRRHPFEQSSISDSDSLPADLNHMSGVVGEETFDSDRSHLVLTSATRRPVWTGSTASASSEDRSEAPAEGAVRDTLSLNLDSAAYPHFSIEAARMRSFTVWSPQHSHTPEELAAAGFFYAGYMDCVRCFYCGLGLKFWRPGDIPAYQHAKYRPHCRFNILYKGQDYIDNVQRELRSEQQGVSNRAENQTAPSQPQEGLQTTTTTSPVVGGPQEQDYLNSEAAKDALRNGWTRDQVRQAVNHIVTEYGESCLEIELLTDILTHFNTHGETSQNLPGNSSPGSIDSGINSTTSQLSAQPASTAPLAHAVTMARGEQERQEASQRMLDEATPPGASNAGQREARVLNPGDILRTVEREHALLEERVTCRLCRSSPVSCIYLPCGHVIACQDCADTATHCVFCQKTIIGTANIFLA